MTGEDDDARGNKAQNEGSEGRSDQAASAQQVSVIQGDRAVAEGAHHDRHHGAQEAHHYRLTLRKRTRRKFSFGFVAFDVRGKLLRRRIITSSCSFRSLLPSIALLPIVQRQLRAI